MLSSNVSTRLATLLSARDKHLRLCTPAPTFLYGSTEYSFPSGIPFLPYMCQDKQQELPESPYEGGRI